MRNWLFILAFIAFALSGKAQSEADFEQFSKDLFTLLSDTAQTPPLEYIRIKTWEDLINAQDLSALEKEEWKVKKNKSYAQEHQAFGSKLGGVVEEYRTAAINGVELEFMDSDYAPHEKWKNWYHCHLRLVYSTDELQSIVEISYDLYYNGRGLVFIGTNFEDNF